MAPPAGANGVLPVTVLQKNTPQKNAPAQSSRGPKAAQPRLKLVCRRLPPGLTKAEFESALGDEWKVGAGKVDWTNYKKGNISTDAAKPSKPARAYLRVTKPEHVKVLGDHVRATTFHDATKSWQDPALVGPPTLEYAPNPKMPGGRRRHDNRQGTIDQDQEFKDFLESLTNPITKPAAPEAETQKEKVKTTPLIEALREKKANRDNPKARGNRQNRGEAKDDNAADKKVLAKSGKENAVTPSDKNRRVGKAEKAQATKEAVKILNKEAVTKSNTPTSSTEKPAASPAPERKRGNVALAKSMLQRDLGVGPAPNRRRGTKREVGAAAPEPTTPAKAAPPAEEKAKEAPAAQPNTTSTPDKNKKDRPTRAERRAFKAGAVEKPINKASAEETKVQTPTKAPAPQILKKPQTPAAPKGPAAMRLPPAEPAAARKSPAPAHIKPETPAAPANVTTKSLPPSPAPAPNSKQAFLKHANPSQGITEPLIEETMKAFGGVDKVEIDKRKGFAYVDFTEPEGLQKAMAASPIKIAQGAVQVLERKEKVTRAPRFPGPNAPPTGPARGGRGGFAPRGGRGGRGGARGGHAGPGPAAGAGEASPAAAPATPVAPASVPVANAIVGT